MLINFKDNGKWGYYNSETHYTIPARFDTSSDFHEGFAIVKHKSYWGVINEQGKEVIPFLFGDIKRYDKNIFEVAIKYDSCINCYYNNKGEIVDSEGNEYDGIIQNYQIAKQIGKELYLVKKDDVLGVLYQNKIIVTINESLKALEIYHKFLITRYSYNDKAYDYEGNLIFENPTIISEKYVVFSADHKYGIADLNCNVILPAKYNDISHLVDSEFSLQYDTNKQNIYDVLSNSFVVKKEGLNVNVPTKVDWCSDFERGKAIVAIGHKYGVMDSNFSICASCIYDEIKLVYNNLIVIHKDNSEWLWDYSDGVIKFSSGSIDYLKDGYFVFGNDYCGVIDKDGTEIIPAKYNKDIKLLDDGTFEVTRKEDNSYCRFDKESRVVINSSAGLIHLSKEIIWMHEFSEGLAIVEDKDGKKGFVDEQGNIVIPCRFTVQVSPFKNGQSIISIDFEESENKDYETKSCSINRKGNFIFQIGGERREIVGDYQLVIPSKTGNFIAYNGLWGVIDKQGNLVIPLKYESLEDFNGFYKAKSGGRIGILDFYGNNLLPCKYSDIRMNKKGNFEIYENNSLIMTINTYGQIIKNKKGEDVLLPQIFDFICDFDGDYAKVKNQDLWGLIDKHSNVVIDCEYSFIGSVYNSYFNFNKGDESFLKSLKNEDVFKIPFCKSALYYNDNCIVLDSNKIINRDGIVKYDQGHIEFVNGYALVKEGEHNYRLIDDTGIIYESIEIDCDKIEYLKEEKVFHISNCLHDQTNYYDDLKGTLDEKIIWDMRYSRYVNHNKQTVIIGGKTPFVRPLKYKYGKRFCFGLARVSVDDEYDPFILFFDYPKKWGYINELGEEIIPCEYDYAEDFIGDYAIVEKEGKKGVVSANGDVSVSLVYDNLVYLTKKWYKAKKDGKWGIIDYNGNIIIPLEYLDISRPSENRIAVKTNGFMNGQWGFIDYANNLVISPIYYNVKDFSDGVTFVMKNWLLYDWEMIDKNGNKLLEFPLFSNIDSFVEGKAIWEMEAGDSKIQHTLLKNGHLLIDNIELAIDLCSVSYVGHFHCGLAKIYNNKKWGFINEQGNIVIEGIPAEVSDFSNNTATYYYNNCVQKINNHGQLLLFDGGELILFDNHYSAVKKLCTNRYEVVNKDDSSHAVIDMDNNTIIPFLQGNFEYINKNFNNEYFKCNVNINNDPNSSIYFDIWGNQIIPDENRNILINTIYEQTRSFSEGLAPVCKNGQWGFVDRNGKEVIPCNYDDVNYFNQGYCLVYEYAKYGTIQKRGVIDKYNNVIIPLSEIYSDIYGIEDGYFSIESIKFGHFDLFGLEQISDIRKSNDKGEIIMDLYGDDFALPNEYEWCDDGFVEGFLSVYKNGHWGVVDTRLRLIINCNYDERIRFNNGIAFAKISNITDIYDSSGQLLFCGEYSAINRFEEFGLFVCKADNDKRFDIYDSFGQLRCSSTFEYQAHLQSTYKDTSSLSFFTPNEIIPINQHYLKFSVNGFDGIKWGICNIKGNLLYEAQFDEVGGIGSGLISVRKGLWGYADLYGNLVIDCKYCEASQFSHGIAKVKGSNSPTAPWALISATGKELSGFVYEEVSEFRGNEILVSQKNPPRENWITENGCIHVKHYHDFDNDYDDDNDFDYKSEDIYIKGYDWCSEEYEAKRPVNSYSDKYRIVIKGDKQGIINSKGIKTFPLSKLMDVHICGDRFLYFKKNDEMKEINAKGQLFTYYNGKLIYLPSGIHWCGSWQDGYIPVESEGKWGLMNSKLEFVIDTIYDNLIFIGNKRFLCEKIKNDAKSSYSIYDIESGNYQTLPYDKCTYFENGCSIVSIFDRIDERKYGYRTAEYKYGLIDNSGKELLPCIYDKMQFREPPKSDDEYYDPYVPYIPDEPYSVEDSLMDALDGEPDAYWNID